MKFILAQIIGIAATIISLSIVHLKNVKYILFGEVAANLIMGLNYLLLDALSGVHVNIIATLQAIVSYIYSSKNKKIPVFVTVAFLLTYTACSFITYKSTIDLIPFVCALLFAMALSRKQSSKYRLFMLMNSVLWLFYDYRMRAFSAMLTHILLSTSTVLAMLRLDRKSKAQKGIEIGSRRSEQTDEAF